MSSQKMILSYLYPILAMIYIASMNFIPYPGHPYTKALPIFLLGGYVFFLYIKGMYNSKSHLLFGIGLLFSTGGDIALALRFPNYFTVGLGLFLVAHLFYILGFYYFPRVSFSSRKNYLYAVLGLGGVMAFFVLPNTGSLLIPVTSYLIVITLMGIFASIQKYNMTILFIGAVVFMISDGIIAINKFVTPVPQASIWIMCTYYIAQGFLVRGILGILPTAK